MLFSQLHGDDEALTLHVVSRLSQALRTGDLRAAARTLGTDWHPPGRNLLPLPLVLLFGAEVWSVRLPNVLAWGVTCAFTAYLASLLSGRAVAWVVGLALGLSGLFQTQAMSFGLAVVTLSGTALIVHLVLHPPRSLAAREARNPFLAAAAAAAVGFLWYTSVFVVAAMLHLAYLIAALQADDRRKALAWWCLMSLPFGVFYVVYYATFLGVPYYMLTRGLVSGPFGQLHQYLVRTEAAHLNTTALLENLRVANYYSLPIVYLALSLVGTVATLVRFRYVALLILPYAAIMSFYMSGDTGQHFVPFVVWTLPFGIAMVARWPLRGAWIRGTLAALLVSLVATWTMLLHVRPYTDATYPHWVARVSLGQASPWPNNVFLPVVGIRETLRATAGSDPVASLIGEAWRLHYVPELRWATDPELVVDPGGCLRGAVTRGGERIRALLTTSSTRPCRDESIEAVSFPDSNVVILLFPSL